MYIIQFINCLRCLCRESRMWKTPQISSTVNFLIQFVFHTFVCFYYAWKYKKKVLLCASNLETNKVSIYSVCKFKWITDWALSVTNRAVLHTRSPANITFHEFRFTLIQKKKKKKKMENFAMYSGCCILSLHFVNTVWIWVTFSFPLRNLAFDVDNTFASDLRSRKIMRTSVPRFVSFRLCFHVDSLLK